MHETIHIIILKHTYIHKFIANRLETNSKQIILKKNKKQITKYFNRISIDCVFSWRCRQLVRWWQSSNSLSLFVCNDLKPKHKCFCRCSACVLTVVWHKNQKHNQYQNSLSQQQQFAKRVVDECKYVRNLQNKTKKNI